MVKYCLSSIYLLLFFFNDTATTEIYTLSLHDALPISFLVLAGDLKRRVEQRLLHFGDRRQRHFDRKHVVEHMVVAHIGVGEQDRKSTRLNSSHANISYAVFCLKKKNSRHA